MVKQAIIPLAGLGTRLLPLSSVIPKELLPINGKPNLEYIMEKHFLKMKLKVYLEFPLELHHQLAQL